MVSPSIEKPGTLVREQPGGVESLRHGGSIWSIWLERDQVVAVYFALTACVVHFLFNGGYGYFRDELYYAALGHDSGLGICGPSSARCRNCAAIASDVRRFFARPAFFSGSLFRRENTSYRLDRP